MNRKQCISLLLALCMIFSIIPAGITPAAAADTDAFPTVVSLNRGESAEDLVLESNPSAASFDGGCGFEIATVGGATNARTIRAFENNVQIQTTANNALAVLKVKAPAGTYKVFMKIPAISKSSNAGKHVFKIGGTIGDKAYRYVGGTELGTCDFAAETMGGIYVFENVVTLPETEGNIHQLAVMHSGENAANAWAWGAIESLYFVPVSEVNVRFADGKSVYTNVGLGGPITAKWAANYVNQLSYGVTGSEFATSTGKVVKWSTTENYAVFNYSVATPTAITYNILVPETKEYAVEFTAGARHKDYGKMYLTIAGTEVGSYDFSDATAANPLVKEMGTVELNAGINTLTISTNETGANNSYNGANIYPAAVKLIPVKAPVLGIAEAAVAEVTEGESASGTLTVMDGEAVYTEATSASIEIADASIASFADVSVADGIITYTVAGLMAGETTATVSVADKKGNVHTDVVSVVVNAKPEEPVVELPVFPTVVSLNRGESAEDLNLASNPAAATFDGGCGFEVATVSGVTNARTFGAYAGNVQIQTTADFALAVLKVKVPAGTYKVFMKTPAVAKNPNAAKQVFKIGGTIGDKAYRYVGGTELGTCDFAAETMGGIHVFENVVTLPETEDNIHQLAVMHSGENAKGAWAWGAIESLYFVPVSEVNVRFADGKSIYTNVGLGGPISEKWAANYVNQLSYTATGSVFAGSTGNVVKWSTTENCAVFNYKVSTPTTISYNILVPETGKYAVEFTAGARHKDYGKMYLDIAGTEVGSYDFSDTTAANPLVKAMGTVKLNAGVNTLTISTNETGANNTYDGANIYPAAVKLVRVADLSIAEDAVAEVTEGESANGTLTVMDGDAVYTAATSVSIEAADASVASFSDVSVADGVISYTVAGLKAGETTATVSITDADGNVHTDTVDVVVIAAAPAYEPGDVNGDGKLNTRDVTTLRRYLAGGYEDTITFVPEMIDVNGDGRENTRDVAALRALIAG